MSARHPLVILAGYWLAFVGILTLFFVCVPPPPVAPRPVPTSTPRILPTATAPAVFHVPTPSPWPTFSADLLPIRPASTRVPTSTPTLAPTATPAPPTPDRAPVQRG